MFFSLGECGVAHGDRARVERLVVRERVLGAARGAYGRAERRRLTLEGERLGAALRASGHACELALAVGGDVDAYEAALASAAPSSEIVPVTPEDAMILMYTSGTTGVPKGALLPHRKTLFNSLNAQLFFELVRRDRVLVAVPLFHSFGLKILSIPALYAGASVILQGSFDASDTWRTVAREGATFLGGVPTMFRALGDAFDRERPDVSSLRFLFTAGAAIPVEQIHAFERRGLVLKQGFGQTETSILCCLDAQDAVRKAGSVGRPVLHAELRIVRSETLALAPEQWRDCAVGETGEIVVRGPIAMLGYWERPEATAETIRPGGWLVTGDLGSFDAEGFVFLTGRSKDLFISGGENVYPRQVEASYEEHPDVLEIAVVGVADERWGEVGRAYVALRDGAALDEAALIAWGRERLRAARDPARRRSRARETPRSRARTRAARADASRSRAASRAGTVPQSRPRSGRRRRAAARESRAASHPRARRTRHSPSTIPRSASRCFVSQPCS